MKQLSIVSRYILIFFLVLSPTLIKAQFLAENKGTNLPTPQSDSASISAPEITTDELLKLMKDKQVFLFDARPHLEYSISHIPGAINVTPKPGVSKSLYISDVAEIGRVVKGVKTAPIVVYCNGPYCGKAVRLGKELLAAGYTNSKRYQLGIPVWRAFGGITEIGEDGVKYVYSQDKTAVWIDARDTNIARKTPLANTKNIPASAVILEKDRGEIKTAKDDGRLPMNDHNTRIIVFADDSEQAQKVAKALAEEAFHNVSYFSGNAKQLSMLLGN